MVASFFLTWWRLLASTLPLFLLSFTPATAAEFGAGLVTDGPRMGGYNPQNFRLIDGKVYFGGSDFSGLEPRVTDRPSTTAILLGDLVPGNSGSDPDEFTKAGSLIFFSARDGTNGRELWATGGTPATTRLVKNIAAGSVGSSPQDLIECQGKLLFTADDGVHGRELWVSDGTSDGTKLVKDIKTSVQDGSNIEYMFNWNGVVYFAAQDGTNNQELWRTDGTPTGTYPLKELNDTNSSPSGFTVYKNELYFQANSSANIGIAELWKTNGTSGGTVLIKNIPGSTSGVSQLTVVGNLLFFTAPEQNHDLELWCSNGTTTGTYQVKDIGIDFGSSPHDLVSYKGALYFVANDGTPNGDQVWKSDGTDAGTGIVHPTFNAENRSRPLPGHLVVVGDTLLFQQTIDGYGRRWFQSDGSSAAFEVVTADPITAIDDPGNYLREGRSLIFIGRSGTDRELFSYAPKLTFTSSPSSRLVATGASASFTVATSYTEGVTFQWQHDGREIPGANAATYTLASATLADGGLYHAVATNGASVTSENATLGVVERTVADATAPEGGQFVFEAITTGSGLHYHWRRAGAELPSMSRITGATAATLQVGAATPDDEGSYTCEVTLGSETVTTLPATAVIITKPVVASTAPPASIVSGAYAWQLTASQAPTSFTVTGLPLGLSFDSHTGLVTGTPRVFGSFVVKVTATNAVGSSAKQSFTLVISPLPDGVTGNFTGLLGRDSLSNGELGGSFKLTVASSGLITGKALFGMSSATLRGSLAAPVQGNPVATLLAVRPGQPTVTLSLTFDGAAQVASGTAATASSSTSAMARPLVWNAQFNPATAYAGRYNTSLTLPPGLVGNSTYPQGAGWLQLKVAASGVVTVSGQTADGRPVTSFTTKLWPDGTFPVLKVLYAGHGSLWGSGKISVGGSAPDYPDNRVTGNGLQWLKLGAANARDHTYAAGFPNVSLTSDGSKWIAPEPGANLLNGTSGSVAATIAFSQAGIQNVAQHADVNQTFQLTGASVAKFTTAQNPCGVKATFDPRTGRLTGSLLLTDPNPAGGQPLKRKVPLSGLVLPHRTMAIGSFLLTDLPAVGAVPATQSGSVMVSVAP